MCRWCIITCARAHVRGVLFLRFPDRDFYRTASALSRQRRLSAAAALHRSVKASAIANGPVAKVYLYLYVLTTYLREGCEPMTVPYACPYGTNVRARPRSLACCQAGAAARDSASRPRSSSTDMRCGPSPSTSEGEAWRSFPGASAGAQIPIGSLFHARRVPGAAGS